MITKAFTLIEIMIVVGIIALLATIAIPNLVKQQSTAKRETCIANLHNIDMAIQQWALETRQGESYPVAATEVLPYLQGRVVCPSGGKTFADSYAVTFANAKPTCLKVPKDHRLPDDTKE